MTIDRRFLALALLTTSLGCAPEEATDDPLGELAADDVEISAVHGGYRVEGCSPQEELKINAALGELLQASFSSSTFAACIESAPLVEFNCSAGQSRPEIVDRFRGTEFTKITCYWGSNQFNAEAPVGIGNSQLEIDHGFVADSTEVRIASVIAHEIMHNRGYRHVEHNAGSTYYPNTVPEQVEACILNGAPNASAGPLTDDFTDRCDGGAYRTIRNGMQACPPGMYLTGVHEKAGRALCQWMPGNWASVDHEFIDSTTSKHGMDHCPPGFAMTGVHINNSTIMCAPFNASQSDSVVEKQLRRQGMMACPVGSAMAGIHAKNTWVSCIQ
jgi:hypothetical protein